MNVKPQSAEAPHIEDIRSDLQRLIEDLEQQAAQGSDGSERPATVSWGSIRIKAEAFQPRIMSERHVLDLAGVLERTGKITPLLVMEVGRDIVLVDGHHRYKAYALVIKAKLVGPDIPVEWFKGTIREAIAKATEENSKVTLAMTKQERMDAAWKLVVIGTGKLSAAATAVKAGISERQVANMRKAKKALGPAAWGYRSWWQANKAARGEDMPAWDDEAVEAEVKNIADRLAKTFSTKLARNVTITARALALYFGRTLPDLVNELKQHVDEDDMARFRDDDDPGTTPPF